MAIAVYGATGYAGRLVTEELVRRRADIVLGGRDAGKLWRLSEERGAGAPVRTADVNDPASLRALLDGCEAVINCAGPFGLIGEPVVRAVLETRTHYVDPAGEQTFMQAVFERYGRRAEQEGVALVSGLGFDYAPGDCLARVVADGREPLEDIVIAYAVESFGASRGTIRSALEMMKGGDLTYAEGGWRPASRRFDRTTFDYPAPLGRQPAIRYPAGEVVTVPRHTRTRKVTPLIASRAFLPHPSLAPVLGLVMPALSLALRAPVRAALGRAVNWLPEGPSEDKRRAAQFTIVAVARGEDGSIGRGTVSGCDVYGLTAAILAYGAERMASGSYGKSGALPPAAAFDPRELLDHLAGRGVSWKVEPPPAAG